MVITVTPKMVNKPTINDIPNEFLYLVFDRYLNFKHKLKAQDVCKLWQQLVDLSFSSKRCLIISDYILQDSRVDRLNQCRGRVSVIEMVSVEFLDRNDAKDRMFINTALKLYTSLETLCISLKFTKIKDNLLSLVYESCSPTLQHLRLELNECQINGRTLYITYDEVAEMVTRLPNLRYFYMDFLILHISQDSLHYMLNKLSQLETIVLHLLCFRGSVYNSDINQIISTEYSANLFADMTPTVTNLKLPCNILSLEGLAVMAHQTNNIRRLFISKFQINCMETIATNFPQMIAFGVSIESEVNEDEVNYLMENIGKLRLLEHLYVAIFSDISINDTSIRYLRSCRQLRWLQFDQTLIHKNGIDAIVKYLPKIESLELWTSGLNRSFHNNTLNDNTISNIKQLKNLRKVNFRGQKNISDKTFAQLITSCLLLETLDFRKTQMGILSLDALIDRSHTNEQTIHVFINETSLSQLFINQRFKRFELCNRLVLSNEEYDHKIDF